jgi:integrase
MSIYLRGKSWYYDFIHKGQRYTGGFGTISRTVAKEELTRKKAEVVEGRLNPAKARKSPRFDAFAEEYLEWVKANRKPLTYLRVANIIKRLTPTFGTKRLNDISAWQIEQYKKTRKDEGNAPATINLDLCFLKALLNKAIAWNKLIEYPAKQVKALKVSNERTRFLSEEEEAQLLAVCSPCLRRIVEAGLLTGFRPGELTALRPADVDLTRNLVHCSSLLRQDWGEPHHSNGGASENHYAGGVNEARGSPNRLHDREGRTVAAGRLWDDFLQGMRAGRHYPLWSAHPPPYLRLSLSHGRDRPPYGPRTLRPQGH